MSSHQGQFLALPPTADVLLEFAPELAHGVFHRPASTVREAADRRARDDTDGVADLLQNLQVFQPPLAAAHAIHDLQHPTRSLAAGRTLPARFVLEETADVVEHVHDARLVVEYGDGSGAQSHAANLARPVEVQAHVELRLR